MRHRSILDKAAGFLQIIPAPIRALIIHVMVLIKNPPKIQKHLQGEGILQSQRSAAVVQVNPHLPEKGAETAQPEPFWPCSLARGAPQVSARLLVFLKNNLSL